MAISNASSPGGLPPKSPSTSPPLNATPSDGGVRLLKALWRSPDRVHQIGGLNRKTKWFSNTLVKDAVDALARAQSMSGPGIDPYFAPAEYRTPNSRTADNILGAYAFWVDLDVGPAKAKDAKGYSTLADAQAALREFCIKAGLPTPTHLVESGSGLHAYWTLSDFLDRETWLAHAVKIKAIAKQFGFLADPTRTADIASVMRLPGTLNLKYDPARPVKLVFESDQYIDKAGMLEAIHVAFAKLEDNQIRMVPTAVKAEANGPASDTPGTASYGPPDLESLASALRWLDPDCDDATWKFHRIAPLARVAREHPKLAAEVYALAKHWSSGELGGKPSKAWVTPSASDGLTGAQSFEIQWKRFLHPSHNAKQTSVGSILFHAQELGWTRDASTNSQNGSTTVMPTATIPNNKAAALAKTHIQVPAEKQRQQVAAKVASNQVALAAMQAQFGLINVGGRLSVFDRISLSARTEQGAAQRLLLSARTDGGLLIRRALKEQFHGVDDTVILSEFWVSPQTLCYAGVDFNPNGTSANYLNLWVGPTITPKAGSWALIKGFFLEVLCSGNKGHCQYLILYIAHALQRPGEKPGVMIILISGQGTGKGTLARILQRIWGATFLQISDMNSVTGGFNAALERTYIVFMDEALFSGDRRASDALKSLVSEPTILINEKHQPSRQVNSFLRIIAATNANHLKATDRDDRRDFTLRVSEVRKGDRAYWQALYHEIETGGVEAMVHDLLALDLSGFNVRAKPDTDELLEQKLQSLEPIPRWWYGCLVQGGLRDDESWPDYVATMDAIAGVVDLNGGKMYRKPSAIDVVNALKKLCSSASSGQKDAGFGRRRGLDLPPLEQARAEFDQYIGGHVQW